MQVRSAPPEPADLPPINESIQQSEEAVPAAVPASEGVHPGQPAPGSQNNQSQEKPDPITVLDFLKAGKQQYVELCNELNTEYLINGKTIDHWRKHFDTKVKEDLTPLEVNQVLSQVRDLYHEAVFNLATADSALNGLKATYDLQRYQVMQRLTEDNKGKVPKERLAVDMIERYAKLECRKTMSMLVNAQNAFNFWKDLVWYVHHTQEMMSTATFSNNTAMKMENSYGGNLPNSL